MGRSFGKTIFWGKDLPKLLVICFEFGCQMEKGGLGEFSICSADLLSKCAVFILVELLAYPIYQ